jgi:DNA-binding response OmpR family regulator
MNAYVEEVTKLRARLDAAECENHFLRERLAPVDNRFRSIGLTKTESKIAHVVYDACPRAISNEQLRELIDPHGALSYPDSNLKVYICKARKKLRKVGVQLQNQYGVGYFFSRQDAETLARIIAAEDSE